jgi:preprotein translocase subunit YajC
MAVGLWPQGGRDRIVVIVRDGELAFRPLPADHSRRQKSFAGQADVASDRVPVLAGLPVRKRKCVLDRFLIMFAPGLGFGAGGSGFSLLLPVLMIGVVYLMMIRPQQKKQKQWTQMLSELKTGDKITTTGGIRGTIISLKDDTLILRVAPDGIKIEVVKSAIAAVTTQEEGSK